MRPTPAMDFRWPLPVSTEVDAPPIACVLTVPPTPATYRSFGIIRVHPPGVCRAHAMRRVSAARRRTRRAGPRRRSTPGCVHEWRARDRNAPSRRVRGASHLPLLTTLYPRYIKRSKGGERITRGPLSAPSLGGTSEKKEELRQEGLCAAYALARRYFFQLKGDDP